MKKILIFEKVIESIFKFLTEIAICFSKCWKFSFFLYSFKRTFFSFRFFEKLFFSNYAKKKKWKNDFFIFHTSLQNSLFITLWRNHICLFLNLRQADGAKFNLITKFKRRHISFETQTLKIEIIFIFLWSDSVLFSQIKKRWWNQTIYEDY